MNKLTLFEALKSVELSTFTKKENWLQTSITIICLAAMIGGFIGAYNLIF